MPAPEGNRFWERRKTNGRSPKFATPDDLREACTGYFEWVEDNPLIAVELVKYQGEAKQAKLPKMRAMTLVGLCNYIGISRPLWNQIKAKSEGFLNTCLWAEDCIYQQKVEGAAAELLNPGFIGKEIGLVERTEVNDVSDAMPKYIEPEYVDPD